MVRPLSEGHVGREGGPLSTVDGGITERRETAPGPPARGGPSSEASLRAVRRPVSRLLFYYFLQALVTGPGLIVVLPLRYVRFRTLRYEFDDEGVSMRWGVLFRREVSLTYARIQDLHLVSNIIERWLGLGRIQVQTASGSAEAEMTIEGLPDFEALRDALYRRMRGARSPGAGEEEGDAIDATELRAAVDALREAAAELRAIRVRLEERER